MRGVKLTESEAGFTKTVLRLAKIRGWKSAHFRPARTKDGWRTAVSGDGVGYPDLTLIRDGRLVVAELKTEKAPKPRPDQQAWLDAFEATGACVFVWRPSDWPSIVEILM